MTEFYNVMVPELTVFNFQASLDFYTKILGFQIKYRRENPDFAYLEYEERIQLMIEVYHESGWHTADLEYPLGRGINFQMEVRDLEPIIKNLNEVAYPLYREPSCSEYIENNIIHRQKEFLVQDPDGYLLRFCQVLE